MIRGQRRRHGEWWRINIFQNRVNMVNWRNYHTICVNVTPFHRRIRDYAYKHLIWKTINIDKREREREKSDSFKAGLSDPQWVADMFSSSLSPSLLGATRKDRDCYWRCKSPEVSRTRATTHTNTKVLAIKSELGDNIKAGSSVPFREPFPFIPKILLSALLSLFDKKNLLVMLIC